MLNEFTDALQYVIIKFLLNNYPANTDITENSPVYILPDFDPQEEQSLDKIIDIGNAYGFVISEVYAENDPNSPYGSQHIVYHATIYVITGAGNDIQATDTNINSVYMGESTAGQVITSLGKIASNLSKYLYNNKLANSGGTEQVYFGKIKTQGQYARNEPDGTYHYIPLDYEGRIIQPTTITA